MDDSDTVVQIGGLIKHCPLPTLTTCTVEEEEPHDRRSTLREGDKSAIGGFIGDGQLAWRALGPTVEVLDPLTCSRQAAWTFGAILHNTSPVVTCVCSIGDGSITHIVIGVDLGSEQNPQGMVGVLSLRRSRIIRAFHFQHKVTSICMITGGEKVVDPSTLANELRPCQGLVAVGTSYASLYLIDLALDLGDEITSDEMCPASLAGICVPSAVPDLKRNEIVASRRHPMLCLSENINDGKVFRLLGPDDNILYETASRGVSISSLLYVPQLASLVVGYSFGSFQMMNLNLITIDCASPYEETFPPVFSFAYQEPENDPRSFVYLWVCRSSFSELNEMSNYTSTEKTSTCSLYAMSYDRKEWIEGHGLWYQGLLSVSPRFDFDATGGIGSKVHDALPSRIVSATTVVGTSPSSSVTPSHMTAFMGDSLATSDEEAEPVPELSLCLFCWEASVLNRSQVITQQFIAIFDINQWYQSQMPSRLRLNKEELCPYMSFHTLDRVPKSMDETLLGGAPSKGMWSRHCSRSHCEKVWYPSSLSYEFNLLTSKGLATYRCPSIQQSALSALVQQGPGAIVNPHTSFNVCVFSGILSSLDAYADDVGSLTVSEREHLLDTALEYHLLSLLVQCVVEFSEGKFSHVGCSSQFLLEWAWKRMKDIKISSDVLCVSLFSSSPEACDSLSSQSLLTLHQNLTFLSHLTTVITAVRDNAGEVTSLSAGELEGRVQVANLLQLHLQAMLWFYHCGLLPQCSPENAPDETSVPFPAEALRNLYESRRDEIKSLGRSIERGDLLLIDSIMEECGDLLTEVWEREDRGESESEGALYPPPSLHALLSMYLLPGIPTHTKHRIVQYLFLDLASLLSENYSSVLEELVKYPSSFSLSPSLIKLTQAFWLIDNKDFQAGLSVLLDPLVSPNDVSPSQHRRIIKAFLYQGEESHALTYTQIRRPPKYELEDIRMNLTLLLANGRIREAFHYQRSYRVSDNTKELLWHFFNGCEHLGRLESVVHLPLTPMEETSFVSYLVASQHPSAQDILIVYYLQQSKYEKISSLHEAGLKNNPTAKCHRRHKTRAALVQGYISHLPDIRAQITATGSLKTRPARTLYAKPQPLSAHIRQSSSAFHIPRSRATTLRSSPSSETPKTSFSSYTPFRSKSERRRAASKTLHVVADSYVQELATNDVIELTRVVFPTRVSEIEESGCLLTPPLFNAASRIATPLGNRRLSRGAGESNLLQEDISRVMEDVLRESMRLSKSSLPPDRQTASSLSKMNLSNEVVSLLKTTPVRRRSLTRQTPVDSLPETPQSILKVRKILQQSQNGADGESLTVSFPRHRSSSKTSRDRSFDKSSLVSEADGLTPKQLRFDLPISRRLSMDGAREEDDEYDEEEESDRKRVSLPLIQQRKRKRSESPPPPPPQPSASSDHPTPRKPLPGYRKHHNSEIKPWLFSDPQDINNKFTREKEADSLFNSLSPRPNNSNLLNKYRTVSEVKDSSRLTPKVTSVSLVNSPSTADNAVHKSISEREVEMMFSSRDSREVHSDSESFEDESFHSVDEEYRLEKEGKRESNQHSQVFNEHLTLNLSRVRPDSPLLLPKISPRNLSPSKQGTISVTVSHRQIVETSDLGTESVEETYRVVYNSSSNETSNLCERTEPAESPHAIENSTSEEVNNVPPTEEDSDHSLRLDTASTKDENLSSSQAKFLDGDSNLDRNSVGFPEADEEIQDTDLNVSYVLKFSDSEEEEAEAEEDKSETLLTQKEESKPTSLCVMIGNNSRSLSALPKSLSKQDTLLLYHPHSESLSKQDGTLYSSCSESTTEATIMGPTADNPNPSLEDCQIDSTRIVGSLPPDLLNVPPFHLTTKEREIVDLMLRGNHSLSLKNFNNRSQQEEVEEETEKSLSTSYLPVLEFSDDEEKEGEEKEEKEKTIAQEKVEEEAVQLEEKKAEMENWLSSELKVENSQTCILPNGPGSQQSADGYSTDDSERTVEFDVSQVPMLISQSRNIASVCETNDIDSLLEKLEEESDAVDHGTCTSTDQIAEEKGEQARKKEILVFQPSEVSNSGVISSKDEPGETNLTNEALLKEEMREGSGSPLLLESSPDNNNICKESLLPRTPSKKAQRGEEEEEKQPCTPSRRSRRLSGLSVETELEAKLSTPTTPLRRSNRKVRCSSVSTPTMLVTHTKRQRRASEASESGIAGSLTSIASLEAAEGRKTARGRGIKKEAPRISEEAGAPPSPAAEVGGHKTPPTGSELRSLVSEGVFTPPPLSEGKKMPKGGRTPTAPHKETPRRRSARISGVADLLGTIVENTTESLMPLTPICTPKKTPLKASPADDQRTTTPRARRRSSHYAGSELLLETIREDSELSSSTPVLPSQEPSPTVATTTPTPSTPSRRSRWRSISVGDPAIDDKENATRLEPLSEDEALDALPVARRTRRASLSSNVSESPPEKSFNKTIEDHTTKDFGNEASSCPSPIPNYTLISPEESSEKMVSARRIAYLSSVSVLFPNAKHSNMSGRKSLKSLPIPSGYEFTLDETPVTKRKPRRRKTASEFASSVLVLSNAPKVDETELEDDAVFESEKEDASLRLEAIDNRHQSDGIPNPPSPGPLYHLLESTQEVPLKLSRRISRPENRSSYRRGISSIKSLGSSCDEEGGDGNADKEKKPPRKIRKSSTRDVKASEKDTTSLLRLPNEEEQGFVFQKPEEILSTAEVVSEAFKQLTQEHEKMVSDTFVFSPPLSLDENRRKRRLEKRKSRK